MKNNARKRCLWKCVPDLARDVACPCPLRLQRQAHSTTPLVTHGGSHHPLCWCIGGKFPSAVVLLLLSLRSNGKKRGDGGDEAYGSTVAHTYCFPPRPCPPCPPRLSTHPRPTPLPRPQRPNVPNPRSIRAPCALGMGMSFFCPMSQAER